MDSHPVSKGAGWWASSAWLHKAGLQPPAVCLSLRASGRGAGHAHLPHSGWALEGSCSASSSFLSALQGRAGQCEPSAFQSGFCPQGLRSSGMSPVLALGLYTFGGISPQFPLLLLLPPLTPWGLGRWALWLGWLLAPALVGACTWGNLSGVQSRCPK